MFRTILVPLDGSPKAEQALPHVETMARQFNSTVLLVRVCTAEAKIDPVSGLDTRQVYLNGIADNLKSMGLAVNTHLTKGDPSAVLVELANQQNIDLVVLSSHGRTGLARLVYGSVAEKVLHRARCPMLLVRPTE